VAVFLQFQRRRIGIACGRSGRRGLHSPPDRVQPTDARIAEPVEYELASSGRRDHLVVDEIRRQTRQREIAPTLPDDLVPGRERDQMREAFDGHDITVMDIRGNGIAHRHDLTHRRSPAAYLRLDWSPESGNVAALSIFLPVGTKARPPPSCHMPTRVAPCRMGPA
jgi:hypothetical protein